LHVQEHPCTCCCLDCIEGQHCGGTVNDHGWCWWPADEGEDDSPWEEDEEEDLGEAEV